MDFKDLLRMLQRRWKTVASVIAAALIIAAALAVMATPIYHSTSKVFISTDASGASSVDQYSAALFSTARVQSYADLATSGELMEKVIKELKLNLTPDELSKKIVATVPTNTVIIQIEVRDPSARVAQQIAQSEAKQLTSYITDLEAPAGSSSSPIKATITDKAQFDGSPVSPNITLNIAIALLMGLLIGFALAVLRDVLDTTVKTHEDIEEAVDAPVLAHVGYDPNVPRSPLLTDRDADAGRAESFRLLRTNLQFLDLDRNPRSFVITSSVAGEGKTSTSVNLAIALAQAGRRVLLVDGDLRRPHVAKLLNLESAVGLTTVLVGRSELSASIQHHNSGVDVLSTGPIPPNPTEILQSLAARDLFKLLHDTYDNLVIDAPPLLPVADAAILATDADGAIMVVRHGKTTKEQSKQAVARLRTVGAHLFGAVANMTPRRGSEYNYEGYHTYTPQLTRKS